MAWEVGRKEICVGGVVRDFSGSSQPRCTAVAAAAVLVRWLRRARALSHPSVCREAASLQCAAAVSAAAAVADAGAPPQDGDATTSSRPLRTMLAAGYSTPRQASDSRRLTSAELQRGDSTELGARGESEEKFVDVTLRRKQQPPNIRSRGFRSRPLRSRWICSTSHRLRGLRGGACLPPPRERPAEIRARYTRPGTSRTIANCRRSNRSDSNCTHSNWISVGDSHERCRSARSRVARG